MNRGKDAGGNKTAGGSLSKKAKAKKASGTNGNGSAKAK